MSIVRECPECLQGKHINCTGQLLTTTDEWVDCSCANRGHLTVNQYVEQQAALRAGKPLTPYAGTSGWSGSDTSEERARTEDSDGTTSERQAKVLSILQRRNLLGATVSEVRDMTGLHHGKVSAALSVLHKEGLIARLTERRDRCKVYVLLDNVDGRETEPHGRKGNTARKAAEDRVRAFLDGRATGKGLDPEHIIGFNLTGLTVSDLRILIGDEQ